MKTCKELLICTKNSHLADKFLPAAAGLILLLVVLGDLGGTIVLQKIGFLSKSPKNSCAWGSWGDSC